MFFSLFLAAVDAHSAAATEPSLIEKFGIDWKYIVIQAISFLILFAVLYKFGIKPTVSTMDERNRKIESGLKYAEEMKLKLEQANQQSADILKKASLDSQRLVDEARKQAKEFLERQTKDATEQSNQLIAKAQQSIELERRKMLADVRGEIARLVTTTVSRVLSKELTDAERARYNEAAARELTSV